MNYKQILNNLSEIVNDIYSSEDFTTDYKLIVNQTIRYTLIEAAAGRKFAIVLGRLYRDENKKYIEEMEKLGLNVSVDTYRYIIDW